MSQDQRLSELVGGPYDAAPDDVKAAMAAHRASIDNIDNALIHLVAERFKHTGAVGRLKAAHRLMTSDRGREDAQAARLRTLAANAGLDPEVAERLIRFLIAEVLEKHRQEKKAQEKTALETES